MKDYRWCTACVRWPAAASLSETHHVSVELLKLPEEKSTTADRIFAKQVFGQVAEPLEPSAPQTSYNTCRNSRLRRVKPSSADLLLHKSNVFVTKLAEPLCQPSFFSSTAGKNARRSNTIIKINRRICICRSRLLVLQYKRVLKCPQLCCLREGKGSSDWYQYQKVLLASLISLSSAAIREAVMLVNTSLSLSPMVIISKWFLVGRLHFVSIFNL